MTEEQLVNDGFLSSPTLTKLEDVLCESIKAKGLGGVPVTITNADLGALIAEVRHWREQAEKK